MEGKTKLQWIFIIVLIELITFSNLSATVVNAQIRLPYGISRGDLVFMDIKQNKIFNIYYLKGYSNDHVVIYAGNDTYLDVLGPKNFSNLSEHYQHFTYWRVHSANQSQKNAAVEVALYMRNRGDSFQVWLLEGAKKEAFDIDAKEQSWYCSEFVWAAYNYNGYINGFKGAGIDIDANGWEKDAPPLFNWNPSVFIGFFLPTPFREYDNDIKQDDNVSSITNPFV